MFFRDGVRRIDFVLSYVDDKDGEKKQVSVTEKWQVVNWLLSIFTVRPVTNCDTVGGVTQFISRIGIHGSTKRKWDSEYVFSTDIRHLWPSVFRSRSLWKVRWVEFRGLYWLFQCVRYIFNQHWGKYKYLSHYRQISNMKGLGWGPKKLLILNNCS